MTYSFPTFPGRLSPLCLAVCAALACGSTAQAQEKEKETAPATMPTVTVNSSADASAEGLTPSFAGNQVARGARIGILGTQDMMDTPFSSSAYTADLIQNQQARSIADVLQNDPTVRMARGFGNFQELYMVRGFPVPSDDMTYNGLYGILPRQYVAAELMERVEVLRGANSFLSGGSGAASGFGIGGTVNILPKRAPNDPYNSLTVGLDNGGQKLIAADIARRFGEDQRLGLRLNLVKRAGDTTVDRENRSLGLATLGADYRGRGFRLSADVGWQDHRIDRPRPNVTPTGAIPLVPSGRTNYAQDWTFTEERSTFGTARAEFDLTPQTTAWLAAGARSGKEFNRLANPNAAANGAISAYRFDNVRDDTSKTAEAGLRTHFTTGSVKHTAVLSAAWQSLESRNAFAMSDFLTPFSGGTLYQPLQVAMPAANSPFNGGNMNDPRVTEENNNSSLALADTIGLMNDRLKLTVGARYQRMKFNSYNYNTGLSDGRSDDSKVSPMAGVVWRLTPKLSAYANYIEGLTRGEKASATIGFPAVPVTNANQFLPTYVAKQKEAGLKYDGGRLGASAAVFSTTKPFGVYNNATFVVGGEQRNQGLELSAFGEPVRGTRVLGGVTFLNAEILNSQGGTLNGKQAIGVPKQQANLGVEWDVPGVAGLALNGRVVYTASQYADGANTMQLPSWTRLDLGARYTVALAKQVLTLRARMDNALNRDYWASAGGYPNQSYLVQGMPRTLLVTGTVDF